MVREVSVQLPQGLLHGYQQDGITCFHNVPYAKAHTRFAPPVPVGSDTPNLSVDCARYGPNCPQLYPTPLEVLEGPPVNDITLDDEFSCGVPSIYSPETCSGGSTVREEEQLLPIIVWIHGGAWCVGGSQTSWYDGSRLAKDGQVLVIAINYRLGVFGFLKNEQQSVPPGIQDIILALEWVRDNCHAFGGSASNITAMGQSAGAYNIQVLLDMRPDLFHRAILQSSPADHTFSLKEAEDIRENIIKALPHGKDLASASTSELLLAQRAAQAQNKDMFVQFSPVVGAAPGGRKQSLSSKTILVAWTKDDGTCISMLGHAAYGMPRWMRQLTIQDLAQPVTKNMFVEPNLRLAQRLRNHGHTVQTFSHIWKPEGFYLGAAHCVDLPLVWGSEKSWKNAPILGASSWSEWDARGKMYRKSLGRFAREGSKLANVSGINVDVEVGHLEVMS